MTFGLREHLVQAIVLDIEGTTTPIAFVYDVLFPFARAHLGEYLQQHVDSDELREPIRRLSEEWAEEVARGEAPPEPVAGYVEWLMDRDRKSPGLKLLQGQIWDRGFRTGELRGDVFPDVPPALQRWLETDIAVAIYSSGSVQAQRLIFSSTTSGDLTGCFSRFFDTAVGAKVSSDSYRRIATELACPVGRTLFVSDVTKELDAAQAAGCQALLCVRPGNPPQTGSFPVVHGFDEIVS